MSAPLLIPEPPLQALPTLAAEVGIDAAIFLQQVYYWSLVARDEEGWVYKTQAEWVAEMPWLSTRTLQRVINRLRDRGMLETKQPDGTNRQTYYRLVVEALPDTAKVAASRRQNGSLTNNSSEKTTDKTPTPRKKRPTVNRKVVSEAESSLAVLVVAVFNEIAGTALSVDPHLTPIVGRIREKPDYTIDHHRKIIEAVFAGEHWWTGPPGPRIIYGNPAQFEQSVELARAAAKKKREQPAYDVNAEAERMRREQGLE